jgi:hypothetical protein
MATTGEDDQPDEWGSLINKNRLGAFEAFWQLGGDHNI